MTHRESSEPPRRVGAEGPEDSGVDSGQSSNLDDLEGVEPDIEETESEIVDPSDSEVLEAAIFAAQFSGPLPPPEILRAYDNVIEGGASRIFDQWEAETQHRHGLQDRVADAYIAGMARAQWMAFGVIMVIGVGGLVIVALGHPLVGFAGFFLALAAVAASFYQRGDQRSDIDAGEETDSEALDVPQDSEAG